MPSGSTKTLDALIAIAQATGIGGNITNILRGARLTVGGLQDLSKVLGKSTLGPKREREAVARVLDTLASQTSDSRLRQLSRQVAVAPRTTGSGAAPPGSRGRGVGGGSGGGARARGGGSGPGSSGGPGARGAIAVQRVQSSNVYAIGYDPETGTLRVQFNYRPKGSKKNAAPQAGPLYDYYDVPPRLWQSFKSASSKGKWVWDKLRIRGTVTGHQYDYRLVYGTVTGIKSIKGKLVKGGRKTAVVEIVSIPRLATGGRFEKRTRVVQGKSIRSHLPSTTVSPSENSGQQFFRGR